MNFNSYFLNTKEEQQSFFNHNLHHFPRQKLGCELVPLFELKNYFNHGLLGDAVLFRWLSEAPY